MSNYTWLIEATITSTIVVIVIVSIRLILKEKLSGKLKYYLWIIFLLRLMVIPLPESPISIYNLIPDKAMAQEQSIVNNIHSTNDNISSNIIFQNSINTNNSSNYNNTNIEKKFNIEGIILGIYKSMLILFLLVSVISYSNFVYKSMNNSTKVKSEYLKRLNTIKRRLKIRRNIKIVYGDTPFIYGIFKIKLVIPEDIEIDELDAVLVHELMHYKYGDLIINWLLVVLKAVYWFNPIVWLVFNQIRKDCEVACDERVIESKFVDKKYYATVLLKNALKGNRYLVGTSSFSKKGSNIKGRIKMIQKFRKKKTLLVVFGGMVFLAVGAICLTNGVNIAKDTSNNIVNDNEIQKSENILPEQNREEDNDQGSNNILENEETSKDVEIEQITDTDSSDEAEANPNKNFNDMDVKVKEYILNGQGDKPEAQKLKWSKNFLDQVDLKTMYESYLLDGGIPEDIEAFAMYITLNAPVPSNWEELFKSDLYDIYGKEVVRLEHLEGDLYQAYINIGGKEVPYIVVSSRTGYYHG